MRRALRRIIKLIQNQSWTITHQEPRKIHSCRVIFPNSMSDPRDQVRRKTLTPRRLTTTVTKKNDDALNGKPSDNQRSSDSAAKNTSSEELKGIREQERIRKLEEKEELKRQIDQATQKHPYGAEQNEQINTNSSKSKQLEHSVEQGVKASSNKSQRFREIEEATKHIVATGKLPALKLD